MTPEQRDIPSFLREAFDADASSLRAGVELSAVLPLVLRTAKPSGGAQLLQEVTALPLRYAPFFDRLAALWDLSPERVQAVLLAAAKPESWRKPGLPGLRVLEVEPGPRLRGARTTLTRFAAGMRFPSHRHHGPEALLVLEGSYLDVSGRRVGAGDLHEMAPGSQHWFRVARNEPCVAASLQFGFEFSGGLMRLLSRLFGGH